MAVLLTNVSLGLRRRTDAAARNAHGERQRAGWGPVIGLHPGRMNETADAAWALGLDPALWPVRMGDLVISDSGASWLVQTSDLIQNNFDHRVDWIRVAALPRTSAGTVPGGAWFVARYTPTVEPVAPDPGAPPVLHSPGLWTGYGPPPATNFGAKPGDEYLDMTTGIVYRLDAG